MSKKLTKEEKHDKLTQVVADLFCTTSHLDVLFKEKEGRWYLGEKKLSEGQLRAFKSDAELMEKLGLWKEVTRCLKYLNNREMFLKARTEEDMIAGKALLFALYNIEKILETARNLKV